MVIKCTVLGALSGLVILGLFGSSCTQLSAADAVEVSAIHPLDRSLSDVEFSGETTKDDFERVWGPSARIGPGRVFDAYTVENYDVLWLSFAEASPHYLTRAILDDANEDGYLELFNELEKTKTRSCEVLTQAGVTDSGGIFDVWGPPDGSLGSGLIYWMYRLESGGQALVVYDGYGQIQRLSGC